MPANHDEIEKRLWQAADELRANSKLRSSEYSTPVLGLIFLRYASRRFAEVERELQERQSKRREIGPTDYQARGAIYMPEASRFENLLKLPEGSDIGKNINMAMTLIENNNPKLDGVLPKNYSAFDNDLLVTLLKTFASIPMMEGDVFGKIYEYFLGEFAKDEGSKGGEFFTPTSLVKLIVEVIEPYHGRIFDPACGSGGMFVQSARFVENHHKNPNAEITVYGQEKTEETGQMVRDRVFDIIQRNLTGMRVDALIVEKRKTGPALRQEARFYPKMLGYLLRYVLEHHSLEKYAEVIVFTDRIPIKGKRNAVEKAVKVTLANMLPVTARYRFLHHDSKSNFQLQIADYCNWAIYRKWSRNDLRSYDLIKAAVKSEFDIFRAGTTVYY